LDKKFSDQVEMLGDSEIALLVSVRDSIVSLFPFMKDEIDKILSPFFDREIFNHVVVGLDYSLELDSNLGKLFNTLLKAIDSRKKVAFRYAGIDKHYTVEPYKLGYDKGFWYLVAGYPSSEDKKGKMLARSLALDKISDLEVLKEGYHPRSIPRCVKEMRVFRPYFSEGAPVKVRVRVGPYAVKYFERKRFVQAQRKVQDLGDAGAIFELEASSYYEIKNTVIKAWYPHVYVVEPTALAKEVFIEMETWIQQQKRLLLEQETRVEPTAEDRFKGALWGIALGNALGLSIEFLEPGSFPPITGFTPCGKLPKGCWGGDTADTLCLAESLLECGGFNPRGFMERLARWYKDGYLAPIDHPHLSAGPTVEEAVEGFLETKIVSPSNCEPPGNASLARLAPVVLYYAHDPVKAIRMAGESSKATHASRVCTDACRYFAGLLVGALMGVDKNTLLSPCWRPDGRQWRKNELDPEVWEIARGSFKDKEPPDIEGSTEATKALEAALWAFHRGIDFEESILRTVNLGDDADTVGAICGQLAGAYYGFKGIPERWRTGLHRQELITYWAERLFE
jgi:ADP-ribosyl-[dinitrogen reductase] hydrolase